MAFKIGSYTIQKRDHYNALLDAGITSNSDLKKLDKNDDKKITEDELVELIGDEDDEDEETEETDDSSGSDGDYEEDVWESIMLHESKIRDLMIQLQQAGSAMGTASDMDTFDSKLSNYESIKDDIKSHREAIYDLLTKAEGDDSSASVSSDSGDDDSGGGKSIKSSKGTASAIANYGLKYNGKSQSEMRSIMTGKGYTFNDGLWCADFVTFCTKETYGKDALSGCSNTSSCWGIGTWAKSKGALMDSREGTKKDLSKVKPGDYIMYNADGGGWYHIGIVTKVNSDGTVDTVEGNTTSNSMCATHSHVNTSNVSFVLIHNIYGSKKD